jgi:hypothetical protein
MRGKAREDSDVTRNTRNNFVQCLYAQITEHFRTCTMRIWERVFTIFLGSGC